MPEDAAFSGGALPESPPGDTAESHPLDELDELAARGPRQRRTWALWLFLLPLASVIVPSLYNHIHPTILGVPFFVWYQLAAVVFGAVVSGSIYILRGTERRLER